MLEGTFMETAKVKAWGSWIASIVAFVVVSSLLHGRVPEAIALGLGFFTAWIVDYPTMRYLTRDQQRQPAFAKHAAASALGASIAVVLYLSWGYFFQ
jgi:Mg2+/citrate symporter